MRSVCCHFAIWYSNGITAKQMSYFVIVDKMDELWRFWSKINVWQLFLLHKERHTNGFSGLCTVCVRHVFILLNYFWIMFPLNDKWFIDFLTLSSNWTINVRASQNTEFRVLRKQIRNGKVCLHKIEASFLWNPNLTSILRKPKEKWFTEIWNVFLLSFHSLRFVIAKNGLLWKINKKGQWV